jgi:peroxiredoxin
MHRIPLFALFAASVLRASSGVEPMRSGCYSDDAQIATVSAADSIQVQTALAGVGPETCYKVVLNRPGETATGYVLGDSLPAVAAFVKRREQESKEASEAQGRMPLTAPSGEKGLAKALDPNTPSHFDDFSWRDWQGKAGSLSELGGRVTLVTFWPPKSLKSRDTLNSVMPLYNELHKQGLAAVGISMSPNPKQMYEVLDDSNFKWPQVPDRGGLAERYHVDPRVGETFVLDASHNVVAAGPMGPDLEKAVRQLLAKPTP